MRASAWFRASAAEGFSTPGSAGVIFLCKRVSLGLARLTRPGFAIATEAKLRASEVLSRQKPGQTKIPPPAWGAGFGCDRHPGGAFTPGGQKALLLSFLFGLFGLFHFLHLKNHLLNFRVRMKPDEKLKSGEDRPEIWRPVFFSNAPSGSIKTGYEKVVKKFFRFSLFRWDGSLYLRPKNLLQPPAIFRRLCKLFMSKALYKNAEFHRENRRGYHRISTSFRKRVQGDFSSRRPG